MPSLCSIVIYLKLFMHSLNYYRYQLTTLSKQMGSLITDHVYINMFLNIWTKQILTETNHFNLYLIITRKFSYLTPNKNFRAEETIFVRNFVYISYVHMFKIICLTRSKMEFRLTKFKFSPFITEICFG